jgi:hypothetical protein
VASFRHGAEASAARLNDDPGTDLNTGRNRDDPGDCAAGYTNKQRPSKRASEQLMNRAPGAPNCARRGGRIARHTVPPPGSFPRSAGFLLQGFAIRLFVPWSGVEDMRSFILQTVRMNRSGLPTGRRTFELIFSFYHQLPGW